VRTAKTFVLHRISVFKPILCCANITSNYTFGDFCHFDYTKLKVKNMRWPIGLVACIYTMFPEILKLVHKIVRNTKARIWTWLSATYENVT
jgi:hypothetical protein